MTQYKKFVDRSCTLLFFFTTVKRSLLSGIEDCKSPPNVISNFTFYYSLRIEILVTIDFFYNFDHSSYSKNCASTIYFVCYML
jgi:hypothetical protein